MFLNIRVGIRVRGLHLVSSESLFNSHGFTSFHLQSFGDLLSSWRFDHEGGEFHVAASHGLKINRCNSHDLFTPARIAIHFCPVFFFNDISGSRSYMASNDRLLFHAGCQKSRDFLLGIRAEPPIHGSLQSGLSPLRGRRGCTFLHNGQPFLFLVQMDLSNCGSFTFDYLYTGYVSACDPCVMLCVFPLMPIERL